MGIASQYDKFFKAKTGLSDLRELSMHNSDLAVSLGSCDLDFRKAKKIRERGHHLDIFKAKFVIETQIEEEINKHILDKNSGENMKCYQDVVECFNNHDDTCWERW